MRTCLNLKMFGKNLFKILLIIGALEQVAFAKPTPDTSVTEATPKKDLCKYYSGYKSIGIFPKDKELSPTEQLLAVTVDGLMSSVVNYSEKAKPLADAILKDSELLDHIDNEEVKIFKQKLETFENNYRDCKDGKQLFKLVELFSETTSEFYEQEEDQKLSPYGKIILKVLKKHKVEQIEQEIEVDIKKLVTKFEEKFAEVKDEFKNDDKDGIGERVIKWHDHFITLKDYDDQIEALADFFFALD